MKEYIAKLITNEKKCSTLIHFRLKKLEQKTTIILLLHFPSFILLIYLIFYK